MECTVGRGKEAPLSSARPDAAASQDPMFCTPKFKLLSIVTLNLASTESFNGHADRFDFDLDVGRSEALRVIGKFRSNPDVARMIVRSAVIIGKADGNFDAKEKGAVEMIARELGINPAEFLS